MAFLIDGKEYEVPTLDSITIGESRVVKRYTGAAGQALQELDPNDPDMTAAMIHIAFKRENPGMSFAALERMVDEVKWVSLDFTEEETEEDAVPSTIAPANSPSDATPSSGAASSENGEPSPATVSQLASGVRPSATTSASDPQTSVI